MENQENRMILNGKDIGISKIELNEWDLLVYDKSSKYCLVVCVKYNWKEINDLIVGKTKNIEFNEYSLTDNKEAALIDPSKSKVAKLEENVLFFDLEFDNLKHTTIYMNKRGCFDIELNSLKVSVLINYDDAEDGKIVYEYK